MGYQFINIEVDKCAKNSQRVVSTRKEVFMFRPLNVFLLSLLISSQISCEGGDCQYDDLVGTCSYSSADRFDFTFVIDGEEVTYTDNAYFEDEQPLAEGESIECTLSFITDGTCTPCLFDIGECGSDAYDEFRQQD